jgi:hypothetical protein
MAAARLLSSAPANIHPSGAQLTNTNTNTTLLLLLLK